MPSQKILDQKKQAVNEIIESLKTAQAGVLVDYRGLTVEEDTNLRNELRKENVKYFVVKNTLLRFAANETGLSELDSILHGPTALAISDSDPIAPAKVLANFAKGNDTLEIKSGFMDGKVLSLDEVKQLAATPSKEVLIAKMMGSLNSPVSGLVRLLNTIVEGGEEFTELVAKKAAESAPAEAPAEENAAE